MMAAPQIPAQELPHNVEAEAALLGALMIENRLCDRIGDRLDSAHFFEPLHARIYEAIQREASLGRKATPVTLKPYFDSDPGIAEVGGPGYLAQLTGSGAAVIGADSMAAQIVELAKRRALLGRLAEISSDAHNWERPFAELCAEAEAAIAEASREALDGSIEISAAEAIDRAMKAGEDSHRAGVLSGIEALDDLIGPIRRKQLAILAGRPGMGKSALAGSYGRAAAHRGHGVLFISLEMSAEELGARIASDETFDGKGQPVPYGLIERGMQRREDIRRVREARDRIAEIPLEIIDIGQATTGRVNALARRWKRRMKARGQELELIIVDYLQKLRPNHKTRDRIEGVAEISQDLKSIAKDNDVGVLALSQLSRAVEQRADHRPQLSDLRESGQIEQDADLVLFLYRAEYYLAACEPRDDGSAERLKWEQAAEACRGLIEFICAKRRQGQTGKAIGRFYGALAAVRG